MPAGLNLRLGLGLAALLLALTALAAGDLAFLIAIVALILAAGAAIYGDRLLVLATCVVVALKTFYLEPTIWSLIATSGLATVAQTIEAYRIFFLFLLALPLILMGRYYARSWGTDIIIAVLALSMLGAFLGVIAWRVPQTPLLVVFGGVFLLALFDFVRTFVQERGQNGG
jgi:hypothetical protein